MSEYAVDIGPNRMTSASSFLRISFSLARSTAPVITAVIVSKNNPPMAPIETVAIADVVKAPKTII